MSDPVFSRGRETEQAPYRKIAATGWTSRLLPGSRSEIYLGQDRDRAMPFTLQGRRQCGQFFRCGCHLAPFDPFHRGP